MRHYRKLCVSAAAAATVAAAATTAAAAARVSAVAAALQLLLLLLLLPLQSLLPLQLPLLQLSIRIPCSRPHVCSACERYLMFWLNPAASMDGTLRAVRLCDRAASTRRATQRCTAPRCQRRVSCPTATGRVDAVLEQHHLCCSDTRQTNALARNSIPPLHPDFVSLQGSDIPSPSDWNAAK